MKVYFVSLGCDKNLVDSEIMLGILSEAGHSIVFEEESAEAIVVNTCSFIADATKESLQTILDLAEYKKVGHCKTLIVAGCLVQRYKEEIFNELPEVDAVVGIDDFTEIARVLEGAAGCGQTQSITDRSSDGEIHLKRITATPQHLAYLKIAEGCDNLCTYCTIPSIRGRYRSRSIESLVKETKFLADKGVKELVLVAQDTALYGKDLYGQARLHVLIKELSMVEGIRWIRIMYCYPEHLTDELICEMAANPKVCHYLDMPVQHGSDSVLKRMGRRSSAGKILETVVKLRAAMPDIILRTSIIAGFPGETEEEFTELLDFIKHIRFDRLGVFAYSKEEGTPAYAMKGHLVKRIKEQRRKKIMRLQMDISEEKCKNLVGQVLEVIVDGKIPEDGVYCGRSFRDCYEVDGIVFFESEAELITGDFVNVRITGSSEYDLTGVADYEFAQ